MKTLQDISRQLGFEWTVLAYELGFNRTEISRFHTKSKEKCVQAGVMLENWYVCMWIDYIVTITSNTLQDTNTSYFFTNAS